MTGKEELIGATVTGKEEEKHEKNEKEVDEEMQREKMRECKN